MSKKMKQPRNLMRGSWASEQEHVCRYMSFRFRDLLVLPWNLSQKMRLVTLINSVAVSRHFVQSMTTSDRFTETHFSSPRSEQHMLDICVFPKLNSCATRALSQNIMRDSMVFISFDARLQSGELLPVTAAGDNKNSATLYYSTVTSRIASCEARQCTN